MYQFSLESTWRISFWSTLNFGGGYHVTHMPFHRKYAFDPAKIRTLINHVIINSSKLRFWFTFICLNGIKKEMESGPKAFIKQIDSRDH